MKSKKNAVLGQKACKVHIHIWKSAAAYVLILALLLPLYPARAAQSQIDTVVAAAAEILYNNEGSYKSVNANDNGAVSVGKLQWHGWRALSLLRTIVSADSRQAKELLGNALYQEISTTSDTSKWGNRTLTSAETTAVKKLLATDESKKAQDELAVKDITSYIEQALRLGITNEPALIYFADLTNQGGSGASGRVATSASKVAGSYAAVTLNELHEAAICDSVMGYSAYQSRRFSTYKYAAGLSWAYCAPTDSYIPSDYETAQGSGAAWIQRALNQCLEAGLSVTGRYDDATKAAVARFQAAKGMTADGYAGKDTIVALIKAVFKSEAVNPGTNPGTDTNNPGTNPGTDTNNPGINPGLDPSDPDPTPNPNPDPKPDPKPEEPKKQAVLHASKTSYAVNDTSVPFKLNVTSSHAQSPVLYHSLDKSVAVVSNSGQVTVIGAGETKITASQAETDTYKAAELSISVTVYSTDPSDYQLPAGALYAGKNMKQEHIQWLQASIMELAGEQMDIDGVWTSKTTRQVKNFQKDCGILADGIAGDQTKNLIVQLLAVKDKKPVVTIKCSTKANTLAWKKYAKANRVYIYRKEKGGKSYVRIKTIKNMKTTSYQDTAAKKGTTYYYVVKYGYIQNKIKVKGPSSKGVAGILR